MAGPHGLTALGVAAHESHEDIVELLQSMKLSQSSTTSPVRTTTDIVSNVDNEAMAILNQAPQHVRSSHQSRTPRVRAL